MTQTSGPDLSVIIPVLDEVEHIDACLEALSRQTLGADRFEVIVVDNGSTDGTLSRLEAWSEVTVLHEAAQDPYAARNRGVQAAQGRVLAFTDGDCTAAPDWLEGVGRAFADPGTEVVVGRLAYPVAASFWLERYAEYYDTKTRWVFETPVPECFYGHGGNMAVRAEVFARLGGFEALPCPGDTELLHRVRADRGDGAVRFVPDLVVTHLEIETLRDLLPKLRHYGRYSAALTPTRSFRALSTSDRLRVMMRCARDHRYGVLRLGGLLVVLVLGGIWFERGQLDARRGRDR